MSEVGPQRFRKFVDVNPVFYQDIIGRTQKQLELKPIFEKLDVGMSKIAGHLQGIYDAMVLLTGVFDSLPVDPKILQLFSFSFSLLKAIQCHVSISFLLLWWEKKV